MDRKLLIFLLSILPWTLTFGQTAIADSTSVRVNPSYDQVSQKHRKYFGENYRKEWAAETKLPVIRISQFGGGLKPEELGGGHQSVSLRLKDSAGNEWVLRSVNKFVNGFAPEMLKGSVYEDWLIDNFSSQHPYSALVVATLAEAVNVPHANPIIGWVAPDKALGEFEKKFAGQVCLLEERNPYGESDNTKKMLENLEKDNKYSLDTATFFRARLLDILLADWDRHQDQWRWLPQKKEDGAVEYLPIPRDRDQVFFVNEGKLPQRASKTSFLSFLKGFSAEIKDPNHFFFHGASFNQQFLNQFTYEEWMQQTKEFVAALPDAVLIKAIDQLPASAKALRKDVLLTKLKGRRDSLPGAMDEYYRFLYSIVDVRLADSDEALKISSANDQGIKLTIRKKGSNAVIFDNTYDPLITKEIRIYTGKGSDSVEINTPDSKITLRIVGDKGEKVYSTTAAGNKIHVYEDGKNDQFVGDGGSLRKHIRSDSLNRAKVFTNLYTKSGFGPAVGYRSNDGVLLGLSYKSQGEGFRRLPYGNQQKISLVHSLITKTMLVKYVGEWRGISGKTDFLINASADIPNNRFFFFGYGNETAFNKDDDFRNYNRVSFSLYRIEPFFRFNFSKNLRINLGPSLQYTNLKNSENRERFVGLPNSPFANAEEFTKGKAHIGAFAEIEFDTRDNIVLAQKGVNFHVRVQGYEGVKQFSNQFAQIIPELSVYLPFNKSKTFVLANRIGGMFTRGEQTFNQTAFLGSHDNLFGYTRFRFAGDHSLYNNLETRINLPNFLRYLIPGKIGLVGFYDVGRVWLEENDNSSKWHQGVGGGIYITPFNKFIFRGVVGFSEEGMFPNVLIGRRF
ncbi:BamA/TamA family outer membrane protein [Desertivirga brevis]|uniref:BamA/TamA family outer membrane protein n=1 Tax=Desertivirga brevis TaxID=2810310 RepID=UPI001A95E730|nr:BamA/TamA family outer membrane protein [Pedobacter sp. SYSU D00873]